MPGKSERFSRTAPHDINSPTPRKSKALSSGHSENGFSLGGKVERILGLVVIEALHSKAIVEKHRLSGSEIWNGTVKFAV